MDGVTVRSLSDYTTGKGGLSGLLSGTCEWMDDSVAFNLIPLSCSAWHCVARL